MRLKRIDWRILPVIGALMVISLLVITSHTPCEEGAWLSPKAITQFRWFVLSWGVYFAFATFDYNRIREATWILYLFMLISLVGLFFVPSTQRVHRWYMLPVVHVGFQPSELAKLGVVCALSWLLERRKQVVDRFSTAMLCGVIAGLPFLLIYKQPDLGTALVLWPITLVIFYFAGVHRWVLGGMASVTLAGLLFVGLMFGGILDHEGLRPYVTQVIKDYQYERLNPHTYHQQAAVIAIALGGWTGSGWRESEFGGRGWLPAAETDSVYPAFAEEFGLLGDVVLLALFYALIYFGFQVTAVAKDEFGRLLSAGITIYLAMHVLTNIAMMCGFLPITGVPLPIVTYGGTSVLVTMAALGVLQSIYSRRFMF